MLDFVEICNVCARKTIIKVAKMKINSDKICRTYTDLNFGVTFLEHSVAEETDRKRLLCQTCGRDLKKMYVVDWCLVHMLVVTL